MNKINITTFLLIAFMMMSGSMYGYKYTGDIGPQGDNNDNSTTLQTRAAGCAPASGLRDLQWNNVRALIETDGSLWQDRATGQASYEVPKDGGTSVLFAGSIWMGGYSPDNQLKLAAVRFKQLGSDYWPGPLTNDGAASIDETTCEEYDNFFVTTRAESIRHRQYFEAVATGTVDEQFPEGYATPSQFFDYPAHGNTALSQDLYLAPFYDYDLDGFYDPSAGDYPWYDFLKEINCFERKRTDPVPLFGDRTFYWIFNDKGNIHSESQGEPIGMEIRAQAFAFSTTDEINDMTFYNYVVINQGTQRLRDTYFATWIDADVGDATDDYVGCDVQRGLGYAYNGDDFDDPANFGYGENPPAVGVDFFEGPYQDEDGLDNPLSEDFSVANDSLGIPYQGLGIGYGDGVPDNERFGMRKFLYHDNNNSPTGDPGTAIEYYRYMTGFWKNGERMTYGGTGQDGTTTIEADYMFPGDTDPFNWGTYGVPTEPWTEETEDNAPFDRRFLQSAGPFTLEPGDFNNITVGVVYARATTGSATESVNLVRQADDKAQALFDNCFELVSGPDAPDVTVQEMDKEVILLLSNDNPLSNNYKEIKYDETFAGFDAIIPSELADGTPLTQEERSYRFQGYQVYQLANPTVSVSELDDPDKSRLVFQCDREDDIDVSVNYLADPAENYEIVAEVKAFGENEGIAHSVRLTDDEFALGDKRMVNHKTYYFMAIAYAHNDWLNFNEDPNGQDTQYLPSRKSSSGAAVKVIAVIPHNVSPELGGSTVVSSYGDPIQITRLEGKGNGTQELDITAKSESEILEFNSIDELTFVSGKGPIEIKVIDPIRVQALDFELKLKTFYEDSVGTLIPFNGELTGEFVYWELDVFNDNDELIDTYRSRLKFETVSEDLLIDYGISVTWGQYYYKDPSESGKFYSTDYLNSSVNFSNPLIPWLGGMPDTDEANGTNWIRSGTFSPDFGTEEELAFEDANYSALEFFDPVEEFEGIETGTWGPFVLTAFTQDVTVNPDTPNEMDVYMPNVAPRVDPISFGLNTGGLPGVQIEEVNLRNLNNVDVVLTSDKSLWTRCPVFEMQSNPALTQSGSGEKLMMRDHPSVDKNGRYAGQSGYNDAEGTLNGDQPNGMGWFPGYAIDIGTGERLNMAFGEDSWMTADNGDDMIWNPSHRINSDLGSEVFGGGQHWIYVFKNLNDDFQQTDFMPAYDQGDFIYSTFPDQWNNPDAKKIFHACTWVGSSILNPGFEMLSVENGLIPTTTRIKLRVAKEFKKYSSAGILHEDTTQAVNYWNPYYSFSTRGLEAVTNDSEVLANEVLDMINVVPNPYYAFSTYEENKFDSRVKITNLPEECTVSIYSVNGTLVRQYKKGDPSTSLDWDLKNEENIPIAGGVYIIHVDIPDVGEKILKWFGVMRPIDLDNF